MGTWSVEFNNIPHAASDARQDIDEFIRGRVAAYSTGLPPAGEVFYFPPGDHVFALGTDEVFEIPEQIELRFAPGARLIAVGDGASLVLRGALVAPIAPIFATTATVDVHSLPGPLAAAIPFGPKIEQIHPEWWGAGTLAGRSPESLRSEEVNLIAEADSAALQSAFHAAIYGEALSSESGAISPRGPVVDLVGTYVVRRPIYLGPATIDVSKQALPPLSPSPLEVRGRFCDPVQVTFWCAPDFDASAGASMFVVYDLPGLLLHCVSFESSDHEVSCVGAAAVVTPPAKSTRLPYVFRHCRFRSRGDVKRHRVALVRIDVLGVSLDVGLPVVEFEGCVFEPSKTLGAAVRLSSVNRLSGATFRGCTFAGHAMAMVDALGFSLSTTGCRFENQAIPPRIDMASRRLSDKELASMHEVAPEGGVDVYLRQNPVDMDPSTDERPKASFPPDVVPGELSAISFSAQDCRSTSPQFLVAPSPLGSARLMRPSTIIGLHHRFEFSSSAVRPPAISWRALWDVRSIPLHLVGCRFDGVDPGAAPRIMCAQSWWPGIFDYGIIAGDGPSVTLTDDIDGRTFGPGLLPQGLIVGCAPRESRRTT